MRCGRISNGRITISKFPHKIIGALSEVFKLDSQGRTSIQRTGIKHGYRQWAHFKGASGCIRTAGVDGIGRQADVVQASGFIGMQRIGIDRIGGTVAKIPQHAVCFYRGVGK